MSVVTLLFSAVSGWSQTARVRVEVSGVEGQLRTNVLNSLTLADVASDDRLEIERIERLHEEAPGEIRRALQPFGYYRAKVEGELSSTDDQRVARYTIERGTPIRVNRLNIQLRGEGRNERQLKEVLADFPLAEGDALLHPAYSRGKARLQSTAAELGYFDARFDTSRIGIDLDAYESEIVLIFDSGPRYRFGAITFDQEVLDSSIVWNYVPFRPGDPFSVAKLVDLQSRLNETPYFTRVEVRPMPQERAGRQVPIHVELRPQKAARYEVGLGYGTDTGPRATGAATLRRLNRRGHRARADVTISGIERSVAGRYLIPGVFSNVQLTVFAGFAYFDPVSSNSDRLRTGLSLGDDWGSWRRDLALTFERESFEVGVDSGTTNLLMMEGGLSQKRTNDPAFTTQGFRLVFDFKASEETLGSSVGFLRLSARGKVISSPVSRWRLIGRIDAGVTATSQFRRVPASVRFFAGGDESVRGYRYRSLGDRDEEGNVIGGKHLLTASGEIEYRFLESWGVAGFYDVGDAMTSIDLGSLKQGVGAGVRWISPIGLVRLDGAFALGDPGSDFRVHLRIGPDL